MSIPSSASFTSVFPLDSLSMPQRVPRCRETSSVVFPDLPHPSSSFSFPPTQTSVCPYSAPSQVLLDSTLPHWSELRLTHPPGVSCPLCSDDICGLQISLSSVLPLCSSSRCVTEIIFELSKTSFGPFHSVADRVRHPLPVSCGS